MALPESAAFLQSLYSGTLPILSIVAPFSGSMYFSAAETAWYQKSDPVLVSLPVVELAVVRLADGERRGLVHRRPRGRRRADDDLDVERPAAAQSPKIVPLSLRSFQLPRCVPFEPGAIRLADTSTVAPGPTLPARFCAVGPLMMLPEFEDQRVARRPGACAGVLEPPGLGERLAGRHVGVIRDGDVRDEGGLVGAGRRGRHGGRLRGVGHRGRRRIGGRRRRIGDRRGRHGQVKRHLRQLRGNGLRRAGGLQLLRRRAVRPAQEQPGADHQQQQDRAGPDDGDEDHGAAIGCGRRSLHLSLLVRRRPSAQALRFRHAACYSDPHQASSRPAGRRMGYP